MPVSQELIEQINNLKSHYSPDEIFGAIKLNPKYADVSEQIEVAQGEKYKPEEILDSLYKSPSLLEGEATPIVTGEADVAGLAQAEAERGITQPEDVGDTSQTLFAPNERDSFLKAGVRGFANELVGIPEVATTLLSGALSAPISYTAKVLTTAIAGGEKGKEAEQVVSSFLNEPPKTEYAQRTFKKLGKMATPFTWPGKAGAYIGRKLDESLGYENKEWEVGLESVGEAPLQALGIKYAMQQSGILKKHPNLNNIKSVDAKIDKDISKIIKEKFYHAVRPTGKKKFSELKEFHSRTGNAERWLAENKDLLKYTDEFTGEITSGHLPKTAIQNAQAFEQGFSIIMKRADDLLRTETGSGIAINQQPLIQSLTKIANNSRRTSSGVRNEALKRIAQLKEDMQIKGTSTLVLDEVLADLAKINSRQGGSLSASLSEHGIIEVDFAHASFLRKAIYKQAEGVHELRSLASDFKTAEPFIAKAAGRRLNIDPEKMDFLDIGALTALVHGGTSLNMPSLFTATTIWLANKLRKHGKDIDIQTDKMYKQIDKVVEPSRAMGKVFSRGGSGLPRKSNNLSVYDAEGNFIPGRQIGYPNPASNAQSFPKFDRSGIVKETSNVPPLIKPTTKALPSPTDIKLGMADRTGKPFNLENYTPDELKGLHQKINKEFNNPHFWQKNPDLVKTMLKLRENKLVSEGEMNSLLYRVLLKVAPGKDWFTRKMPPRKGTKPPGNEIRTQGGAVYQQDPRTGEWHTLRKAGQHEANISPNATHEFDPSTGKINLVQ